MADMTDKEAIEDMRQGGTTGFEELHRRYQGRLKGYLMSSKYYGFDKLLAEDICNKTFFRFYQKIDLFKQECSVFSWLCRLARNFLPKPEPVTEQLSEQDLLFEHDIETLCIERCVRQAIAKNKNGPLAKCLKALMFSIEGMSIKEIAEKIGRTENATTTFMTGCRKRLRETAEFKRCWEDC